MAGGASGDRLVGFAMALTFVLPSLRAVTGDAVPVAIYLLPPFLMAMVAAWRLAAGVRVIRDSALHLVVGLALLWIAWQGFSGGWSVGTVRIRDDVTLLALTAVYGMATAMAVTPQAVTSMVSWIIAAAALVAAFVLVQYLVLGDLSGYTSIVYDYYLTVSLLLALGCVGAALRAFTAPRVRWKLAVLTLFLFVGLGLSLARGVLVFVALVLAVLLPLAGAERVLGRAEARERLAGKVAVIAPMVAIAVMGVGAWTIERTRIRILRMISGTELEAGGRGDLWSSALDGIRRAWVWGHGLGSSGLEITGVEGDYPHNLFLQVWLDGGLPGVLLLAALLGVPMVMVAQTLVTGRARLTASWLAPLAMFTVLVLEYAKSEHVYTARSVVVMAIALVVALRWAESAQQTESGS